MTQAPTFPYTVMYPSQLRCYHYHNSLSVSLIKNVIEGMKDEVEKDRLLVINSRQKIVRQNKVDQKRFYKIVTWRELH